eukprot:TRINITY_DN12397_c0_g1_i4.p2 TRINITY_DN12397_c0_g1~~TRINITY_DN12397_c0_g1_i4.p2  ORF type:complete len:110 (-),score=18.55 TRINITY_DN12397_c0_g1_i4:17-346(-)
MVFLRVTMAKSSTISKQRGYAGHTNCSLYTRSYDKEAGKSIEREFEGRNTLDWESTKAALLVKINRLTDENKKLKLKNSIMENRINLSLIHICRCRRYAVCRSRWSPYH